MEGGGGGAGGPWGRAYQQPAVRTATHPRDLMMLDESDRLPQHRPAHPVTLLKRLLRNPRLTDRPATPDDVGLDTTRNLRSSLIGPAPRSGTGSGLQKSFRAQLHVRTM